MNNEELKVEFSDIGLSDLLRDPKGFLKYVCECPDEKRLVASMLAAVVIGWGLLGLSLGFFVGWQVALLDAGKMIGAVVFSYVLCMPSLYVFSSLSGMFLDIQRISAIGLSAVATMGCVMAALSPIIWLFSVSTTSVHFMVMLGLGSGAAALFFGLRALQNVRGAKICSSSTGLYAWIGVFVVVCLQFITIMRPMLSPLDAERSPKGKCFFLQHFMKSLGDNNSYRQ